MSFDTFSTNFEDVSVFYPGLPSIDSLAKKIVENTKFRTAFSTVKAGVNAYVNSPTMKNEAKAWGALETFNHFLIRNMLDTHVGFVSPFKDSTPQTIAEVISTIDGTVSSDFSPDMNGMFVMSLVVNSVRTLLKSPAYYAFAGK